MGVRVKQRGEWGVGWGGGQQQRPNDVGATCNRGAGEEINT